jgi:hypothetical protein
MQFKFTKKARSSLAQVIFPMWLMSCILKTRSPSLTGSYDHLPKLSDTMFSSRFIEQAVLDNFAHSA